MDPTHNRLAHETSPYLRQHADNPVDWFPWGEEALNRAREQDRPILLSIGYSACHWCHVMAHESFEDPDIAAVMNNLFVNIKVDREERPDLDKIYQTAHSLLTRRSGGWPLTMMLTPRDQIPFFGGTYFPKTPRHGLPAFPDLLTRVAAYFRQHRNEIDSQNRSMVRALEETFTGSASDGPELSAAESDRANAQLADSFDPVEGGFGTAPKFPHAAGLEFLLRRWERTGRTGRTDTQALHRVHHTLTRMAHGGIYDHLGGGFYRYSVDGEWMIPHFEKMLYDNGPLLGLCSEVAAVTGDRFLRQVAHETARWVIREIQGSDGGYFATLDADSEGEEGRFYTWTRDAVRSVLDDEGYAVLSRRFGLDRPPNFEGRWHLHVCASVPQIAGALRLQEHEVGKRLAHARERLFEARTTRVHPGRDEKVLTGWNGLMIRGMATAARYLGEPDFVASARRALQCVRDTLWRDGRLMASSMEGKARLNAYLDDYALLIDGILELVQVSWHEGELDFARLLADAMLDHYLDRDRGGFYFTSDDHERLVQRPKSFADESLPSGNAVAARVLHRLGHLFGDTRYLEAAEHTLAAAAAAVRESPYGHTTMLLAHEEHSEPLESVILRGSGEPFLRWRTALLRAYRPQRLVLAIPSDVPWLPAALADKAPLGPVSAYVCRGTTCLPPIRDAGELRDTLELEDGMD